MLHATTWNAKTKIQDKDVLLKSNQNVKNKKQKLF